VEVGVPLGTPMLTVDNLSVVFGGVVAVDGVSLKAYPGRVVGLIGPNGAGKTTTIDAITGFNNPNAGEIEFDGRSLEGMSPGRRNRLGVARTFQALELFEDLSVEENLLVASERRTLVGRLLDLVAPQRSGPGAEVTAEVMERLRLAPFKDRLAGDLSTAERKRVAIGRALASRPRLMLLDEPAAGLDATEGEDLGTLLRSLIVDGTGILIIDHDVGLMFNICDYIYVLDFGVLIAEGTPDEIRADQRVVAAYLGNDTNSAGAPLAATRARALALSDSEEPA
jgi:ABC-type branched-subunit amino acid transport system ATPase component